MRKHAARETHQVHVVLPVAGGRDRAAVHVHHPAHEHTVQDVAGTVVDGVLDDVELREPRDRVGPGQLLDLEPERDVLLGEHRADRLRCIVTDHAGEHLLPEGPVVLVDAAIEIIVVPIEEVFIDEGFPGHRVQVLVVVDEAQAVQDAVVGPVHLVDLIEARRAPLRDRAHASDRIRVRGQWIHGAHCEPAIVQVLDARCARPLRGRVARDVRERVPEEPVVRDLHEEIAHAEHRTRTEDVRDIGRARRARGPELEILRHGSLELGFRHPVDQAFSLPEEPGALLVLRGRGGRREEQQQHTRRPGQPRPPSHRSHVPSLPDWPVHG